MSSSAHTLLPIAHYYQGVEHAKLFSNPLTPVLFPALDPVFPILHLAKLLILSFWFKYQYIWVALLHPGYELDLPG